MSSNTLHSQCFDSSRLIDPEDNEAFIKENTCLFCNKLASDICQCQLGCGALFGYGCFSSPDIDSCPKCNKTFDEDKSQYKNRYLNKLVTSQVSLKCINFENGCTEVLPYNSEAVQKHENSCDYFTVFCAKKSSGCKWEGAKAKLEEHIRDCEFFEYICSCCQEFGEPQFQFLKKEQTLHESECLNIKTKKVLGENKLDQQVLNLIKDQQKKIADQNKQITQIIDYAVSLEKTYENQRDKKVLLNDFKNGILNFNSLEYLKSTLEQIDREYVKGVKLNDTNLSCYEYSFASKTDFSKTIASIKKYAKQGEKNSQYSLARLYYWGDKDIAQDIAQTERWAKKALQQNSAEAQWLMGDLYYENKGSQGQDFKKAFKYYEQAASMGNAEATNSLGQMYDDGEGYPSNEEKALTCFQKSASLGDYGGLYNLAVYYQEGYGGLQKNLDNAFQYYLLSAQKGDIDAMKRVAILLKQGKGCQKDLSESNKWAKRSGYYKNKFTAEIPTMASLNSFSTMNQFSETCIRSDVI